MRKYREVSHYSIYGTMKNTDEINGKKEEVIAMEDNKKDLEVGGKDLEVGGKNPRNKVIVGKVYANWCGHCQNLKPEWARMKTKIHKKRGKKHIVYAEVEEKEIGTKLRNIENRNNVEIAVNGYPTLFKIVGGKVEYYNGNRESQQMADWYLDGGSGEANLEKQENGFLMPNLLKDVQGGRRPRYFTRSRNKHNYRRSRHHTYTHLNRSSQTRKKKPTAGIFDFLFGAKN